MRISEATIEQKPLAVTFGSATLNLVYRPLSYTVKEMEDATKDRDPKNIVRTMQRLLVEWDLTDDDNNPIPLSDEALVEIPSHIFTGIMQAVAKDSRPDPEV